MRSTEESRENTVHLLSPLSNISERQKFVAAREFLDQDVWGRRASAASNLKV